MTDKEYTYSLGDKIVSELTHCNAEIESDTEKEKTSLESFTLFKDENMKKLQIGTQFELLGLLVYQMCKIDKIDNYSIKLNLMKELSKIGYSLDCYSFNHLYSMVIEEIYSQNKKYEFYYQGLFKEKISKLLPCKVIKGKSDSHNIPDAWIELNEEEIPVEVKLYDFNNKALKQLERYMQAFNCKHGIAVARELCTELPENIRFIPISELEKVADC